MTKRDERNMKKRMNALMKQMSTILTNANKGIATMTEMHFSEHQRIRIGVTNAW